MLTVVVAGLLTGLGAAVAASMLVLSDWLHAGRGHE